MGIVSPAWLGMLGSEAVGGAESTGELQLRAAAVMPTECYTLAAAAIISVLVLLSASSARGALRNMPAAPATDHPQLDLDLSMSIGSRCRVVAAR
jgi:hypothetical protein